MLVVPVLVLCAQIQLLCLARVAAVHVSVLLPLLPLLLLQNCSDTRGLLLLGWKLVLALLCQVLLLVLVLVLVLVHAGGVGKGLGGRNGRDVPCKLCVLVLLVHAWHQGHADAGAWGSRCKRAKASVRL